MGDVGSLGIGGAIGMVAVLIKQEFLLVMIGGRTPPPALFDVIERRGLNGRLELLGTMSQDEVQQSPYAFSRHGSYARGRIPRRPRGSA